MLAFARAIDWLNAWIGKISIWATFLSVMVAVFNALARKQGYGSNFWLELQWELFSITFLFSAAMALMRNEHIRIDILHTRFHPRTRNLIDIFGHVFILIPFCLLILWFSTPWAYESFSSSEGSLSPSGMPQWWAKILVPPAFFLLFLQAISEIIKRVFVMQGKIEDPYHGHVGHGMAEVDELEDIGGSK